MDETKSTETAKSIDSIAQTAFRSAMEEHSPAVEEETTERVETAAPEVDHTHPPEDHDEAASQAQDTAEQEVLMDLKSLIADVEDESLRAAYQKKYDEMNRNYTQKTQSLSEQRKSMEAFQPIVDALQENPEATIKEMARVYGIQVQETPAALEADAFLSQLSQVVGEDAARQLRPAFEQFASQLIESKITPLQQKEKQREQAMAQEQVEQTWNQFGQRYPDYVDHKDQMEKVYTEMMQGDQQKVLEALYLYVTKDNRDARATQKVVEKIQKSARKVPEKGSTVPKSKVAEKPPDSRRIDKIAEWAWNASKKELGLG